ncbi:hypothetical protein [Ktedonospora formicarum]|uniref:Uncharacterized protein n=1 Tax=Ktedonospora formicarum TaxID=2778364 RepID=A0A8J3HXX1_9CHLR|nr:hypothetical protein [Ktedonospora formicarum]GHO45764.1 hypothetical protein KSX_39270 [Ktedonospora formicarum]
MTNRNIAEERLNQPQSQTALRNIQLLVGFYLGLSVLTLVAIVLLRNNPAIVTPAVWIRGTIVLASALLTAFFTVRMARGSRMGYLGLRLESAIMFVAIVVIIALPGLFPMWMKIEQGICGLLLLGVVVIVNGKHLRSPFATK